MYNLAIKNIKNFLSKKLFLKRGLFCLLFIFKTINFFVKLFGIGESTSKFNETKLIIF